MANPARFKDVKASKASSNKPNTWPTILTPPAPADIHTLPDVVGDDQLAVVSAEQQRDGLPRRYGSGRMLPSFRESSIS